MTPVFLKPYSSNVSDDIGDQRDHQDQNKEHLKLFVSLHNEGSSSSSSLAVSPSPTFLSSNTCQDQSTGVFQMHEQRDQKDVGVDLVNTKYEDNNGGSGKYWMSSKMRLIHKMANPETPAETDQAVSGGHKSTADNHNHYVNNDNNKGVLDNNNKQDKAQITFSFSHTKNNSAALIRVCSDCNTTSTPLWRSGPRGPKSLCNACGIRQRKARRAMAEAASAATGGGDDSEATKRSGYNYKKAHIIKEKKGRHHHHHYKSKLKLRIVDAAKTTQRLNGNKLCFRDLSFALNDNHSVFPRDVAEAAVLLMELSCHGLLHS